MRNFLLSSVFILLVCCQTNKVFDSSSQPLTDLKKRFNIPFTSTTTSYLYKTGANIYGHYLSGLLLIKPAANDDYRIVFTNEVGVKFFDFESSLLYNQG